MLAENLKGFEKLPQTIPHYCLESLRRRNKPNALGYRTKNGWSYLGGKQAEQKVLQLAAGFYHLGIRPGDKVAIISENRIEWSLADLALLSIGAIVVPIYTTQAVEQIDYVLKNSNARALIVSGTKTFEHASTVIGSNDNLESIIFFDEDAVNLAGGKGTSLSEIEKTGNSRKNLSAVKDILANISTNDLATIIYTSGTTGEPKGVMLTHQNFVSNIISISRGLPIKTSDKSLSVLPLSHIFERTVFFVLCANGVSIHFCSSYDQLASQLQEVQPTIMTAVPRLFEQVYHKIVKKGRSAGGYKTRLFNWALEIGQQYWAAVESDTLNHSLKLKHRLASRLVFSKWRTGVGGSLRFFVSGGAPLSKKLSYAFWAAGIPILQGYGMTEACIVSANRPDDHKIGSIGKPFEGIEMKISESDGEILVRGPNVMLGYYNKPEETRLVLDSDGFYHTGDVGYVDEDGHFYITDRLKDLFKLSNGKYIAPLQIESILKQSPLVSQAVVVGSGRKQVGALIVPDWESLKDYLKENKISADKSKEELCRDQSVIKLLQREAIEITRELSEYERIKRVYLLAREFSIDKGEMTPTLKIKRSVIDEKYKEAIDEICGD